MPSARIATVGIGQSVTARQKLDRLLRHNGLSQPVALQAIAPKVLKPIWLSYALSLVGFMEYLHP